MFLRKGSVGYDCMVIGSDDFEIMIVKKCVQYNKVLTSRNVYGEADILRWKGWTDKPFLDKYKTQI